MSLDDQRETDEHREQQAPSAARATGLFQRLTARIERAHEAMALVSRRVMTPAEYRETVLGQDNLAASTEGAR